MAEVHKCRICNTRLNVFELNGRRTYTHAGQHTSSDPYAFDHVPDPVPEVEYDEAPNVVCDFCGEPLQGILSWRNEARGSEGHMLTLVADAEGNTKNVEYNDNNPDWLACDGCQVLINADDRERLITRSAHRLVRVGRISKQQIPLVTGDIKQMHDLFFMNRTGSVTKLPN